MVFELKLTENVKKCDRVRERIINKTCPDFPLDKLSLLLWALSRIMILLGEKFTNLFILYKKSYTFPFVRIMRLTGIIMSEKLDFYAYFQKYLFCNHCNEKLRNHLVVRNFMARSTESLELPQSAPEPVLR